ncbi:zinc finger 862-like [Paramuricea clavata]|uniref:Zinc finger 862-like n=1 Tax=Paramuricea clavata TaxID=317549 RepID=A0A7D9HSA7_PARCT|nr:zinc finger 862-like [Paramuricea clavata]
MKGTLEKDLKDARYYSVLCDGSTDTSVKSQELFYVLYIQKDGRATCKLMSVETADNKDAAGLKQAMTEAFARFGIVNFECKLAATGLDGASVNMGRNTGLAARLKEIAPWLTAVHCFNHHLELAAADAFNVTFFAQLDEMLRQLFSLYQKSPKKLRELKKLAEAYGELCISLSRQAARGRSYVTRYPKQKIKGFLARWKDAHFPMFVAIFVDIIGPLRVLSLGLQADDNDPKDCKAADDNEDRLSYQDVVLTNYARALNGAAGQRQEWMDAIVLCLSNRFKDLQEAPVYKHLCPILDTQSWPGEEVNLISYGDESVTRLVDHFAQLLKQNGCDVSRDTMLAEWSALKLLISETYGKAIPYLDVWAAILSSPAGKEQFSNILNIVELLLITPISNAVVERMFSTMARMKPHLRNRMS